MRQQSALVAIACLIFSSCTSEQPPWGPDGGSDGGSAGEGGPAIPSDAQVERDAEVKPDPIAAFFRDFHAARYSRAAFHASALDEAAEQQPSDGVLALDRALAHLWHVGEAGRDPGQDQAALAGESAQLPGWFQRARELSSDPRIDCFLGTTLMGAGRALHDEALLAQGIAALDRGVAAFPEFNLFCRALAYAGYPASDPRFAIAVDSVFETLDVCYGEPVDRDHPDIAKYLDQATDEGPKRVCWNDAIAPHNAEGFYLFFGDLLVKQGKVEVAKVAFGNATQIREYASWPYKSLIEDRLGGDLEAKAALYADDVPDNDPPLGGDSIQRGCAYCHASTAEE